MKALVEIMVLEAIKKSASVMSLYKVGYSYSQVMQWCERLQQEGKIEWDNSGARLLTDFGKKRLIELKKNQRKNVDCTIQPLLQYKVEQISVEDIFLP